MVKNFLFKLKTIIYRVVAVFWFLPTRLRRFFRHIYNGLLFFVKKPVKRTPEHSITRMFLDWWVLLFFYGIDCIGMSEIYETVIDLGKPGTRPLYDYEIALGKSVFGESINYQRIRIDERAWLGPRQQKFCYVSFNIINSWGKMPDHIFIHELVHIWQFQNLGAIYIPKAMQAQFSPAGYNYGGIKQLRAFAEANKSFLDFNFEQQGDIVADYFRLTKGKRAQWGNAGIYDLPVYEYFIRQIRC